jgi:hypothetical protein
MESRPHRNGCSTCIFTSNVKRKTFGSSFDEITEIGEPPSLGVTVNSYDLSVSLCLSRQIVKPFLLVSYRVDKRSAVIGFAGYLDAGGLGASHNFLVIDG